ncbi:MAG: cytochrome c maturation protein CcmE [Gemmatimonadetes bacterium]|uniref:Cytochrome c maturation protein CcmE n=1 Tax=Candidatus Kutchimonas denitrificans TaxID=3056748 RepID=A0AAE4Z717_9BACT|nr:cytochrome c maturation protein CcmE [Gemmatimonadota bacterium]NIR74188.1 cytochrome c maturation protein CcmE [Candidatus Kutchimonas denitrificans]NIR99810.1 cytochrome c maturation protein CcmE [Gemmatimonadota bacterium]NIT65399.1 cytochrome c maturation protein CcmE [Gemmatimonadota bacterium]NIU51765.1 cytochrome c maturation protein CcmE [Gemmatimonadota bacterium]
MNKKLTLAIGVLVVVVVFGYFAFGGLGRSLVYFWTPSELLAEGDAAYGTSVRLGGMVEPGSVRWDAETQDLRFRLVDEGGIVEVQSVGVPPQMFLEATEHNQPIGAVVEGSLTREGVFRATNLMVKHSEEYRAPQHAGEKDEYYRELFEDQGAGDGS